MGTIKANLMIFLIIFSTYTLARTPLTSTPQTNLSQTESQKIKDYYQAANGLVDSEQLFKKLQKIVTDNHHFRGYSTLYKYLAEVFQDGDHNIIDYYSNNPHGQNPYNYDSGDKCGTYRQEGDCFNREHIFPQGIFGKRMPMKSDYHHIVPTDGYVNNRRSNYPFGEVGRVDWRSQNGSKLGSSETPGYNGKVFEPIDEFKGDIARALFYFAVRYQKVGGNWRHETLNNADYLFYKPWYVQLLKEWHEQDPVDEFEKEKNSAGFEFQKNRNPFIDHPEWVELIW